MNSQITKPNKNPTNRLGPWHVDPFVFPNEVDIPRRQWLYGKFLIRKELSVLAGAGGTGKTSFATAIALSLASGRRLLGESVTSKCRVLYWSGEEPFEELQRRFTACAKFYKIDQSSISDRLFVENEEKLPFLLTNDSDSKVSEEFLFAFENFLIEKKIDVIIVDPLIAIHQFDENDNQKINQVASALKRLAKATNTAVLVLHHMRKGDSTGGSKSVDDARGARSLIDKARVVRAINPMSEQDAKNFGIQSEHRRRYVSYDPSGSKSNMTAATGAKQWFELQTVAINAQQTGNLDVGDEIAVVQPWNAPTTAEIKLSAEQTMAICEKISAGYDRKSSQSQQWAGNAVLSAMGSDFQCTNSQVEKILKNLVKLNTLRVIEKKDAKGVSRPSYEVGDIIFSTSTPASGCVGEVVKNLH